MRASQTERKMLADTTRLTLAQAAGYAINLVGGLILARILGVIHFGYWKAVQDGMQFNAMSNLGANYGSSRISPSLITSGKKRQYQSVVSSSFGFSCLTSAVVGLGALAWSISLPPGTMRITVLAFAILAFIQPLYSFAENSLLVEKKFGAYAKYFFSYTAVRVLLSVIVAAFAGLTGALVVFALTLFAAGWLMFDAAMGRPVPRLNSKAIRSIVRVGFPIMLLILGEQLLLRADRLIVFFVLGPEQAGLYQMAIFPLPLLLLAPMALRQVTSVDIYDRFGREKELRACRGVYERSVMAIAFGSPVLIGVVYYGLPWLITFAAPSFIPAIPAVKLYALLIYPILIIQTAFSMIVVAKREFWMIRVAFIIVAMCTLTSLFLNSLAEISFMTVLAIQAIGWFLFASVILFQIQRLLGDSTRQSTKRIVRWFIPMAYLAIELPFVWWLAEQSGLRPESLPHGLLAGALHLVACSPMMFGLEKRTGAVSFLMRKVGLKSKRRK